MCAIIKSTKRETFVQYKQKCREVSSMKKTLNLLVMSILIFFMNIMIVKASKVIYDSKNANGICNSVKKETIKIGVHSYYNKNDTILKQTENTCNNTKYFTDNLSNKTKGQDYPSWTLFNMSNSSFKHSIEGVDVTDNNKYRYFYIILRPFCAPLGVHIF